MNAMKEKRTQILKIEEARRNVMAERRVWMEEKLEEPGALNQDLNPQEDVHQKRSLLSDGNHLDVAEDENIDDDELALARKLERENEMIGDSHHEDFNDDDTDNQDEDDQGDYVSNDDDENIAPDNSQAVFGSDSDDLVIDYTQDVFHSVCEELVTDNTQDMMHKRSLQSNVPITANDAQEATDMPINSFKEEEEEREFDEVVDIRKESKGAKSKNSAWKAALLKEAEHARKQKKMRALRDGLVEAEAEEEEEEEGIAGLEDFGFTIGAKKKSDDDEDNDDIMDEDLDNVVDDLSDNEGDEEAGEKARRAFEVKEEIERLKEIKRRVKEGYDGRREGIAGGIGSARGVHRFDQLVAADNFEEAKRLGIHNDDESDDEGNSKKVSKDGVGEIDDENDLLHKALVERHMKKIDLPEYFSDEEEDDNEDAQDEGM